MSFSSLQLLYSHYPIHHRHHRVRLGQHGGKTWFPSPQPEAGVKTPVKDWQGQSIQGLFSNSKGQVLDANGVTIQGLLDKNGTLINASDNLAITGLTAQTNGTVLDQTGVAIQGLSIGSTYNPTDLPMGPGPAISPNNPFEFRGIQNSADHKVIGGWSLDMHTGQAKNNQAT